MSGGQFNVPIVVRMSTGGGNQLGAQHSHSLEGWMAHIPGIRIVAPATVEDARGMLAVALADPDPVLIFEHSGLQKERAVLDDPRPAVDLDHAAIRRAGRDLTLITYGGMLPRTREAAEILEQEGIDAELIDLRTLRPLDQSTLLESVARTHRAVVVDEGWRSGGLSAEIAARIQEESFYDLDAPVARVCTEETPIPYPKALEDAALPSVDEIVAAARRTVHRDA
jgi:pyruvate dehydrogenase E1 component beta subunit